MATIVERGEKEGKKIYSIQVSVKNIGANKTIRKAKTVKLPQGLSVRERDKELNRIAVQYEEEIKTLYGFADYGTGGPDQTFANFAYKWLERIKEKRSASHYVNSKDAIAVITAYIGGYKLTELTPSILQYAFDEIDKKEREIVKVVANKWFKKFIEKISLPRCQIAKKAGITDAILVRMLNEKPVKLENAETLAKAMGKNVNQLFNITVTKQKYSDAVVRKIKVTTQGILSYAKRLRLIQENYATRQYLDFPEQKKKMIDCLTEEEANEFFQCLIKYPKITAKIALLTVLLTGVRRGELCALEWKDVHLKRATLTIRRSKSVVRGFGVIEKSPKNETSIRVIALPKLLVDNLIEYKAWYDDQKKQFGDAWEAGDKIIVSCNGQAVYPQTVNKWLDDMLQSAGLPKVTVHSLRHTNITLQIMQGVPLVTVSKRAGHARSSTTSDVYAYFFQSTDRFAADCLDGIFSS